MSTLPYVTAPGNIKKALDGISTAAIPERVSQDFVKSILKIPGSSGDQMTTFLRKLGLANPDGTPSETYTKFRNPSTSGFVIADAIKKSYAPLYIRNEYMHTLDHVKLKDLVIEVTGHAHDSKTVSCIVSCIKNLKEFADFEKMSEEVEIPQEQIANNSSQQKSDNSISPQLPTQTMGLNLGYTINLNLPASSDPAVFDAIFKSLKENLLREGDV